MDNADKTNFLVHVQAFHLLQACPDLVSFTWNNSFREAEFKENQQLPLQHKFSEEVGLRVCELHPSHVNYVLSCFPSSLKSCQITLTETDSKKWLTLYKSSALRDFGCYLGNVKDLFFAIRNYDAQLEGYYQSNSYETISRYESFIEATRGQWQLLTHVYVTIKDMERFQIQHQRGDLQKRHQHVT